MCYWDFVFYWFVVTVLADNLGVFFVLRFLVTLLSYRYSERRIYLSDFLVFLKFLDAVYVCL